MLKTHDCATRPCVVGDRGGRVIGGDACTVEEATRNIRSSSSPLSLALNILAISRGKGVCAGKGKSHRLLWAFPLCTEDEMGYETEDGSGFVGHGHVRLRTAQEPTDDAFLERFLGLKADPADTK